MTSSNYKPLHLIVSGKRDFVTINKEEFTNYTNSELDSSDWNHFIVFCQNIFGHYADFVDVSDDIFFQEDELIDKELVKVETLRFLNLAYKDCICSSVFVA